MNTHVAWLEGLWQRADFSIEICRLREKQISCAVLCVGMGGKSRRVHCVYQKKEIFNSNCLSTCCRSAEDRTRGRVDGLPSWGRQLWFYNKETTIGKV
jgi:hypothetical protein